MKLLFYCVATNKQRPEGEFHSFAVFGDDEDEINDLVNTTYPAKAYDIKVLSEAETDSFKIPSGVYEFVKVEPS